MFTNDLPAQKKSTTMDTKGKKLLKKKSDQYIGSGVRTDFETLIEKFKETQTVRYEMFCAIWQQMKMPLIYHGRQNNESLAQFVNECLQIASDFWLNSTNFQVQIGGLYLVYGIYETQPCNPKLRLMVTHPDWQKVLKFIEEAKEQCHLDVCYVYRKLLFSKAFYYGASPRPVQFITEEKFEMSIKKKSEPKTSTVSDLLDPINIAHLEALHIQYHTMKCALAGPDSSKPDPSLRVIQSDLVDVLKTKVEDFEEWRKNPTVRKTQDSDDDNNDKDYVPPRTSKRAEIKAKAFRSSGPFRRDRRHRKGTSSEDDPAKSPKKRGRKSQSGSEKDDMPVPSTSAIQNLFPSMPVLTDLQDTGAKGKKSRKRKSSPTKIISSPSKMPKVVLSPEKGKTSSKGKQLKKLKSPTSKKKRIKKEIKNESIKSEPESLPDLVAPKTGKKLISSRKDLEVTPKTGKKSKSSELKPGPSFGEGEVKRKRGRPKSDKSQILKDKGT